MNNFFNTFIIQPMNYILFFFKTKLFTVAGLWSALFGGVTMIGYSVYDFIVPVLPFVVAVFALTLLDMFTGTQAAKVRIKNYEKENPGKKSPEQINSRGYFRTSQKIGVYVAGILGVHTIWIAFGGESLPIELPVSDPLVYLATFPMAKTELKSLDENIRTVTGVSFWGAIGKYLTGKK